MAAGQRSLFLYSNLEQRLCLPFERGIYSQNRNLKLIQPRSQGFPLHGTFPRHSDFGIPEFWPYA